MCMSILFLPKQKKVSVEKIINTVTTFNTNTLVFSHVVNKGAVPSVN